VKRVTNHISGNNSGGGGWAFAAPPYFKPKGMRPPYSPGEGPPELIKPIWPPNPAPEPVPIWLRFAKWMFNADTEKRPRGSATLDAESLRGRGRLA